MVLEEVAVRTAFFRRESAAEHGPDGWTLQGMNRHTILRYAWRDRLRRMLGKSRSIRRVLSELRPDGQADPEGTPLSHSALADHQFHAADDGAAGHRQAGDGLV